MADTLDVLTIAEARKAVGIGDTDTSHDTELAAKVTAVSRLLDEVCGPVVRRTITDEVHPGGTPVVWARHPPVDAWITVTEYNAAVAQVLTAETFDTQPAHGYVADRWPTATANYTGRLHRRSAGTAAAFPAGPEAVKVTYVSGRYTDTASVDARFKEAAGVMLKNAWRPLEVSVASFGEFDVPAQNFPRFGIPNFVPDTLRAEWLDGPVVG